ncbi:MAG: NAD(P)-binding domain-containing protein [Pseudomonadota bacterium]
MTKQVAIIGAGASGLCGARHMVAAGFDVTIYEIGSQIGGMWVYQNDNGRSSAYKTLHINTAKHLTAFEDFPFDESVPPFPNHRDMAHYLNAYAEHHDLRRLIRFNTRVVDLRPAAGYAEGAPQWEVETEDGDVASYDTVIVATGHLTKPMEAEDLQGFGPGYLHSHDYKDPAEFAGKRICVVGIGNSAMDIASDLCTTAESCVLVARSTPLIIPKLIFGRPFWDVVRPLHARWVPGWLRSRIVQALVWIVHGRMSVLGFGAHQKKIHAASNANIVNHIRYRRVIIKQGIDTVEPGKLTFMDGATEEFDHLIAATGYQIETDFLKPDVLSHDGYRMDLYMRIVPPAWRGLYFLGFFNSDTALNWIAQDQVRWIVAHETGAATLPSVDAMQAEIAERTAWVETNFKDTPRHGIEVEHIPYFRDLRRTRAAARRRARAGAN